MIRHVIHHVSYWLPLYLYGLAVAAFIVSLDILLFGGKPETIEEHE